MKTKLIGAVLVATFAASNAVACGEKISIVDAKALTPEQLEKRICRDMGEVTDAVNSANDIANRYATMYQGGGWLSATAKPYYYAQVSIAGKCAEVVKANQDTFDDLYSKKPTCDVPSFALIPNIR